MSGKLPIDRVREAEDAPRVYDDHKQRFAEKQAKLRDLATGVAGGRGGADAGEAPETDTEGADA